MLVIPRKQQEVLAELHVGHTGIVKMKSLARLHVWWPGIDKSIENIVQDCVPCQSNRNNPLKVILHPWSWLKLPWQILHIDFAGPSLGKSFLIAADGIQSGQK